MVVALGIIATIVAVLFVGFRFGFIPRKVNREPAEVARYIQDFIDQSGGEWDWDDFTSIAISDPHLDEIRLRCGTIQDEFPPTQEGEWCAPEGLAALREIVSELNAAA